MRRPAMLLLLLLSTLDVFAQTPRRRALLIGINDYTASRLPRARPAPAPGRDWPNLTGAVNDAGIMQNTLTILYGFDARDIVTLTDQAATRAAILQSLEELVRTAAKGDVILFYYAGHGSHVENSRSDEPDKMDETLVPADSRRGAPDIRDKELRVFFNRILERGAHLTIILDSCYSGSGARGLPTGAFPRGVKDDPRDIADATNFGPRPEARGALVLSATSDEDQAWETRDREGTMHGSFSWAMIRAIRDSAADETAEETFVRARARMRAETPFQDPVMAGNAEARLTPFLGSRVDRRGDHSVIAIESVRADGTIMLQGGWIHGLTTGSELRVHSEREITTRIVITALHGLARSEARVEPGRTLPQAFHAGALLEVAGWAAPPGRALRVWMPRVSQNALSISSLAKRLSTASLKRGVRWVNDPVEVTPTHLLRHNSRDWELLGTSGSVEHIGGDASALAAIARIPAGSSLFVQFPAPAGMTGAIDVEGVEPVERAEDADYILAGHYATRKLEYAWVRPAVRNHDRRKTGLPLRTTWTGADNAATSLRVAVMRLRKIHAWHLLESPPETRAPYRLGVRRGDGQWADDSVIGNETYSVALRAASPLATRVASRYYYAFIIDSYGKSFLAFPRDEGSVENRFPVGAPTPEIALGAASEFVIQAPYGVDTYFLLATDEPLANPWVLEWDGVRSPANATSLEQLLMETGTRGSGSPRVTPPNWSIEKAVYESVTPRHKQSAAVSH